MKMGRILILGNSITRHSGLEGSGWELKDCGMAASAPEKDYVHLLLKRFTDAAGCQAPESLVENIAKFEREYDTYDVAGFFKRHAEFKPDIIIMAIGENVPPLETKEAKLNFHKAMTLLLKVLNQDSNSSIFVRSCFWEDKAKDDILRRVCEEAGGTFVSLVGVDKDKSNFAHSERTFSNVDVGNHPGDKGMKSIADVIWKAVENRRKRATKQKS
ncbi:MAG: SGNH/GDSL hydrolase family protein [Victivallales bacterium]